MACEPLADEPFFTLLARDQSAPDKVRQWAYERRRQILGGLAPEGDIERVESALKIAKQMEHWRAENEGVWRKPRAT